MVARIESWRDLGGIMPNCKKCHAKILIVKTQAGTKVQIDWHQDLVGQDIFYAKSMRVHKCLEDKDADYINFL